MIREGNWNSKNEEIYIKEGDYLKLEIRIGCNKNVHVNRCDVICKNVPHGGTNCVILDQLFSISYSSWSGSTLFVMSEGPFSHDAGHILSIT